MRDARTRRGRDELETVEAVLLDIEGTTTPIAFVHEVLFPYAARHAEAFLREHWDDPGVVADVALLREEAARDAAPIADGSDALGSTLRYVRALMAEDRKSTGLKSLQGRIWHAGYADGTLKATLFADVAPALRSWHAAGLTLAIYSSGSVAAQKLLFAHTEVGDLCPLLSAYFDTTSGPKRETASYAAIASALLGAAGEGAVARVLFLTDVVAEADAAREAGLQTAILDRPGNHPQPAHEHRVLETFAPLTAALTVDRA